VSEKSIKPASHDLDPVWRERGEPLVAGAGEGPLAGLRIAVKDVFAVAGHRMGAGNPAWLSEATPQPAHAWAVRALLEAGADITGIARTDEFAYSLDGTNAHYGTPPNPAAPGRVPGGSSNGPASAVALGEVDAGLAGDTSGSVRVPASYCGLYGIRTTHGAVPVTGMLPLAPRFDAVGWLTRDAETLRRLGEVLLPQAARPTPPHTALIAADLVALAQQPTRQAFTAAAARLADHAGLRITRTPSLGGDPGERAAAFTTAQGAQVWEHSGPWVSAHPGALGPGVTRRFARAAAVTPDRRTDAENLLRAVSDGLRSLLTPGTVLLLPAAVGPAPVIDAEPEHKDARRQATVRLTCLAGIGGLPCVVLPLLRVDGLPVGLAVVGGPGSDHDLLRFAARYAAG
jgi:amidase